ncbi:GM18747, partial [Drosophila sechellia]
PSPRFVSPVLSFNVASIDNFFAPVFSMRNCYAQSDKVLIPLAIQVHHADRDRFDLGRMLHDLPQQYVFEQGGA